MTIISSGSSLSFTDIYTEFGLPPGKNLGAYRLDGGITVSGLESLALDNEVNSSGIITALIPKSGTIKFSDFYGKKLNIVIDCTVNQDSYEITKGISQTNRKAFVSFITPQSTLCPFVVGQWITVSGMVSNLFNGDFIVEECTSIPAQAVQITKTYTNDTNITLPNDASNISITLAAAKGGTGGKDAGGSGGGGGAGRVGTFTLPNGGRTLQFKIGKNGGDGSTLYQSQSGGGTAGTSNVSAGGKGGGAGGHGSSGGGGGGGGATGVFDSVANSYIIVAGGGAGGGGGSLNRGGTAGSAGIDWSSSSGSFSIAPGLKGQDKGASPADGGGGGAGGGGAIGIGGKGGNAGNDNSASATGGIGGGSKYNSNFSTLTSNSSGTNNGDGYATLTYTTYAYTATVRYTIPIKSYISYISEYGYAVFPALTASTLGTITGGPLGKTNAKSKYINRSNDPSVISLGFHFKDTEKNSKVWIHTNSELASDKPALINKNNCSLLVGGWDATTDLRLDIGLNGNIMGAGGAGGKGGDAFQSSISVGEKGNDGNSGIGITVANIIITNRGRIAAGGAGGGGGGGAEGENRRRNKGKDQHGGASGGGGGGGMGYPVGSGGAAGGGDTVGTAGQNGTKTGAGGGGGGGVRTGQTAATGGKGGDGSVPPAVGGTGGTGEAQGRNGGSAKTGGGGGASGNAIIISNNGSGVNIKTYGTIVGIITYNTNPV
jgi:hypothetical protein